MTDPRDNNGTLTATIMSEYPGPIFQKWLHSVARPLMQKPSLTQNKPFLINPDPNLGTFFNEVKGFGIANNE